MGEFIRRHLSGVIEIIVLVAFFFPQVLHLWKRLATFRASNWKLSNPDRQEKYYDQQRNLLQSSDRCCVGRRASPERNAEADQLAQQSRLVIGKDLLMGCGSALSTVCYLSLVPGHMLLSGEVKQQSPLSLIAFWSASLFFVAIWLTTQSTFLELVERAWGRILRNNRDCQRQILSLFEIPKGMSRLVLKILDFAWPWMVKLVVFPLICTYETDPPHVITLKSVSCWDNQVHWLLVFTSSLALQALLNWQLSALLRKCSWPREGPEQKFEGIWREQGTRRRIHLEFPTDENCQTFLIIKDLSSSRRHFWLWFWLRYDEYCYEIQGPLRDSVCTVGFIEDPAPAAHVPQESGEPLLGSPAIPQPRNLATSICMLISENKFLGRHQLDITRSGNGARPTTQAIADITQSRRVSRSEDFIEELSGTTWHRVAFLEVPFLQDPVSGFSLTLLKAVASILWSALSHRPRYYGIFMSAAFLIISSLTFKLMRMTKFSIFEFVNNILMYGSAAAMSTSFVSLLWAMFGQQMDLAWTRQLWLGLSMTVVLAIVLLVLSSSLSGVRCCLKRLDPWCILDSWCIGGVRDTATKITFSEWCTQHQDLLDSCRDVQEACVILNENRSQRIVSVSALVEPFTLPYPTEDASWKNNLQNKLRNLRLNDADFDVCSHDGTSLGPCRSVIDSDNILFDSFPLQFIPIEEAYSEFQNWDKWRSNNTRVVAAIKGASSLDETVGTPDSRGLTMLQLERQVNIRKRVVKSVTVWRTHAIINAIEFVYDHGCTRTFGNTHGHKDSPRLEIPDGDYLTKMSIEVGVNSGFVYRCTFGTYLNRREMWGCLPSEENVSLKGFKAADKHHIVNFEVDGHLRGSLADMMRGIVLARISQHQHKEFRIKMAAVWLPTPSLASRRPLRRMERRSAKLYNLKSEGQLLKDVKAKARALVFGISGSGKSTLLSALCKFALDNDAFDVKEQATNTGVTTETAGVEYGEKLYLDTKGMEGTEIDLQSLLAMKESLAFGAEEMLASGAENLETGNYVNHFLLVVLATERRWSRLEGMLENLRLHFGANVSEIMTIVFTDAGDFDSESKQQHVRNTFQRSLQDIFGKEIRLYSAFDQHQEDEQVKAVKCVFIDTHAAISDLEHKFSLEDRLRAHSALRKVDELIVATQERRFFTHIWPPVVRDYDDLKITYEEGETLQSLKPSKLYEGSQNRSWNWSLSPSEKLNLSIDPKQGIISSAQQLPAGCFSLTITIKAAEDQASASVVVPRTTTFRGMLDVALTEKGLMKRLDTILNHPEIDLEKELRETRKAYNLIKERSLEKQEAVQDIVSHRKVQNAAAHAWKKQVDDLEQRHEATMNTKHKELQAMEDAKNEMEVKHKEALKAMEGYKDKLRDILQSGDRKKYEEWKERYASVGKVLAAMRVEAFNPKSVNFKVTWRLTTERDLEPEDFDALLNAQDPAIVTDIDRSHYVQVLGHLVELSESWNMMNLQLLQEFHSLRTFKHQLYGIFLVIARDACLPVEPHHPGICVDFWRNEMGGVLGMVCAGLSAHFTRNLLNDLNLEDDWSGSTRSKVLHVLKHICWTDRTTVREPRDRTSHKLDGAMSHEFCCMLFTIQQRLVCEVCPVSVNGDMTSDMIELLSESMGYSFDILRSLGNATDFVIDEISQNEGDVNIEAQGLRDHFNNSLAKAISFGTPGSLLVVGGVSPELAIMLAPECRHLKEQALPKSVHFILCAGFVRQAT